MLFVLHIHNEICIRMSYVNEKKNICIFENITGRTYTNAHMTNSDIWDTIVNATCQYYSGKITLDMSDHRLIFFLHIQKNQNNVNCGNCMMN